MPTYIITIEENNDITILPGHYSDVDGTQKVLDLPNDTRVLLTNDIIEKWHRQIAAEKLGALVADCPSFAIDPFRAKCPNCGKAVEIPDDHARYVTIAPGENCESHTVTSSDFAPARSKAGSGFGEVFERSAQRDENKTVAPETET